MISVSSTRPSGRPRRSPQLLDRPPRPARRRRIGRPRGAALLAVLAVLAALAATDVNKWRGTRAAPVPKILFGLGDEISAATAQPLYQQGGINMVTSWYNGPADLAWMSGYAQTGIISGLYGQGKALELVVWLANEPDYAVSAQFQSDIAKLINIFRGNGPYYGPLYVVLFTEFETYSDQPGYDARLRSSYLTAVKTIHSIDRQAYVALGFGGYNWTAATPVRNLNFWRPAIKASDFTAFQAMQAEGSVTKSGENIVITEIEDAVRQLGRYGKPVMISHFKLWGDPAGASRAFARVASKLLTRSELAKLTSQGLFAWDFMDDAYLTAPGPGLVAADAAVTRFDGGSTSLPPVRGSHGQS